jgi:tricorn protease interacting factor F2/3
MAANLHHLYVVAGGGKADKIASIGAKLFGGALERMGYEPREHDRHTTSILRDQLLWHAVLFGSEQAAAFAKAKFSDFVRGGKVHPDIMRSVMQAGAFLEGEEALRCLTARFQASPSEHERMNILVALGCFRQKELLEQVQEYVLDQVPDRNKFITIGALAENIHAIPALWPWYLSNQGRFEAFHPIHYERVLAVIIPYGGLGKEKEVKEFFETYLENETKAKDAIKLSLERLEIHSRMRRAFNA